MKQHGGLADSGIASKQDRRCRNDASAEGAVEFRDSSQHAGGFNILFGEVPQLDGAQSGGPAIARASGDDGLLDRVPFPAGVALAGPFVVNGAT